MVAPATVQVSLELRERSTPAQEEVCWVVLKATNCANKIIGLIPHDKTSRRLPIIHHKPIGFLECVRTVPAASWQISAIKTAALYLILKGKNGEKESKQIEIEVFNGAAQNSYRLTIEQREGAFTAHWVTVDGQSEYCPISYLIAGSQVPHVATTTTLQEPKHQLTQELNHFDEAAKQIIKFLEHHTTTLITEYAQRVEEMRVGWVKIKALLSMLEQTGSSMPTDLNIRMKVARQRCNILFMD